MDPGCTIPLRWKSAWRLRAATALAPALLASGCATPSWLWPPPLGVALVRGNVAADPAHVADPRVIYLAPVGRVVSLPSLGGSERVEWRAGAFDPQSVAVRLGDEVRIVNDGPLTHRLFTAGDNALQIDLGPHSEYRLRTGTSGPIHVYCSLHPSEYLLIYSVDQRYLRAVAADGSWSLGPVAPGDYHLVLWTPSGEERLRTVRVWPWTVHSVGTIRP